jgi:hypothetical protein
LALSLKTLVANGAVALAVTAAGALGVAGTAYASTPAPATAGAVTVSPDLPHPHPPSPHRFRSRFNTLQRCQFQARHDHPRDTRLWDCRRGRDPRNPWEYWGA